MDRGGTQQASTLPKESWPFIDAGCGFIDPHKHLYLNTWPPVVMLGRECVETLGDSFLEEVTGDTERVYSLTPLQVYN